MAEKDREPFLDKVGSRSEKIYLCPADITGVIKKLPFRLKCAGEEILLDLPPEARDGHSIEQLSSKLSEKEDLCIFMKHIEYASRDRHKGKYTFINLKPATLYLFHEEIATAIKQAEGKIVIEIKEEAVEKEELKELARLKKKHGFMFSLDDFGTASSNFDRIKTLKPEFIKIEIPLFETAHELVHLVAVLKHYSPQSILIAEKVETEKDLQKATLAQITLWQGFYERNFIGQK